MLFSYGVGSVNARCMLTDLAPFHFYLGLPVIWAQALPPVCDRPMHNVTDVSDMRR